MDKHNDEIWKQIVETCVTQEVKLALEELKQEKV